MTAVLAIAHGLVFAQAGPTAPAPRPAVLTPEVSWPALLPLLFLVVGALLLLTFSSLLRTKLPRATYPVYTCLVALGAMICAVPLWARVQGWNHLLWWDLDSSVRGPFSTLGNPCSADVIGAVGRSCGAIGIDGFSLVITMAICASIVLAALFASDYLHREGLHGPELYVLMLLSGAGGLVMAMANDLIVLFLGLETLSIAVYVLAAMHRKKFQSQEAGIKYFVLGAFSSAFFLYGIAMVYGATATTNLISIKNLFAQAIPAGIRTQAVGPFDPQWELNSPLLLLGIALMLVGLGFKVAAVPFHFWSPDVYDGSPTPVVVYMASGVKAAGFAALVRVFALGFESYANDWRPAVAVLAALSMIVGSLLAIVQTNVKRTLAYSSINHAGFILMALAASSAEGNQSILFYVVSYTFMVAGSFGVVTLVARRGDNRVTLADYRGLASTNPGLAFLFTVFLLSQAGVPFTSGFVAKLYTVIASIAANATWLAIVGMVSSVVATYLYLRIIVSMYMKPATDPGAGRIRIRFAAGLALALCFIVTVGAGIFPGPLTDLSNEGRPALVTIAETAPAAGTPGAASPTTAPGR